MSTGEAKGWSAIGRPVRLLKRIGAEWTQARSVQPLLFFGFVPSFQVLCPLLLDLIRRVPVEEPGKAAGDDLVGPGEGGDPLALWIRFAGKFGHGRKVTTNPRQSSMGGGIRGKLRRRVLRQGFTFVLIRVHSWTGLPPPRFVLLFAAIARRISWHQLWREP